MTSEGEADAADMRTPEGASSRASKKTTRKTPQVLDASALGLVIYTQESNKYPQTVTLEHISSNIKTRKYKFTYNVKRPEAEIWHLIEKQRIRFTDADLKIVPDDMFRKIRQGQELSPQQQQQLPKKSVPWHR